MTWTLRIILNRMKAMKNIFKILLAVGAISVFSQCTGEYDPLPPKTDASVQYALPYYETPDADEIDEVLAIRKEHEQATK